MNQLVKNTLPQCTLGDVVNIDLELFYPGVQDGIEVNLKGRCCLYVVGYMHDSEGSPIYVLSDIPVEYPVDDALPADTPPAKLQYHFRARVEYGHGETSVSRTGRHRELFSSIDAWLESSVTVEFPTPTLVPKP